MKNKIKIIIKRIISLLKIKITSKKENIDSKARYNKAKANKAEAEANMMMSISKGIEKFIILGMSFMVLVFVKTIYYSDLDKIEINKNTIKVHFTKTIE